MSIGALISAPRDLKLLLAESSILSIPTVERWPRMVCRQRVGLQKDHHQRAALVGLPAGSMIANGASADSHLGRYPSRE